MYEEKPHSIWWIAHIFLGVISGLVVYVLYKDKNPKAAKRHLIFSILIGFILFGVMLIFGITLGASDYYLTADPAVLDV